MSARIDIFVSNDVIFTEVGTRLDLDQDHRDFAGISHAMYRAEGDVDGLIFRHQLDLVVDGDFGGARHVNPVFGTVVVALQGQRRTGVHMNAFDLKTVTDGEAFEPAPKGGDLWGRWSLASSLWP